MIRASDAKSALKNRRRVFLRKNGNRRFIVVLLGERKEALLEPLL